VTIYPKKSNNSIKKSQYNMILNTYLILGL